MSKRWSYAVFLFAVGCGNTPVSNNGGFDVPDLDVNGGQDAVASDTGGGKDAVAVDTGGGQDVVAVDAGGQDVVTVDAGGKDAATDAGGTDASADAGGDTDASADAGGATDASTDAPAAPSCPTPTGTISLPGTVAPIMGTTAGTSQVPSSSCQSNTRGPENVYTLTVTAPTGVELSTVGMGTAFDTVLSVRRTCTDAMSEVACSDDATGLQSFIRTQLEPGTYSVIVDGYNTAMGAYALTARSFTVAPNATCATALPLTTTGLTNQDLSGGINRATTCLTGGAGQFYYSVQVAPGTQATVRATPTGTMPTWTPQLRLLDDCAATTCLANASGTSGMPGALTFANNGTTMRTYFVSVSASSASATTGTFDLSLATQMLMPGASCAMALDVTAGMGRMGESTMNGGPANTVCQTGLGTQRWFRVSIPAGQRLTATATPAAMSGRRAAMRILDDCEATACLASTGGTTNMPSSVGLTNAGTTARTVFLSVSGESTTMPMAFDLATSLTALTPSSVCERATALTNGMMAMGDTGQGIARPTTCFTTDLSNEVFYSVTVPAGQRTAVLVQPASGATWRPRIRSVGSCAATACFSNIAGTADGGPATLNLDNPTQLPRTMVVSVSTTTAMTGGAFAITATNSPLSPAPMPVYALASITGACDDLSMGTAVAPASGWADDSTTAIAALPFSVPFFGVAQTHFSVASNGFAMLYPAMTGTTSSSFSNALIPTAGTPNNLVAPFWDDMVPATATGVSSTVRTAALGTMPNRRFVIGWENWRTLGSASTERLSFQAKLFETTGVVEFHYCTLTTATTRGTGDSATVGIENADGTAGNLVGYNFPDTFSTTRAFRLTPAL